MPIQRNLAICVPTLNAEKDLPEFIRALREQTVQPNKVLILDSSSEDNTVPICESAGFEVRPIPREQFDHGGTRRLGASILEDFKFILFFTQDAYLANPDAIDILLENFKDPSVAATYGRQLPRPEADPIEAFDRRYNYGEQRLEKSIESIPTLGFKTIFCSNSFCCYRTEALLSVGSFPEQCAFGEDSLTAAALIQSGLKVVYEPGACVYHSHNLSFREQFQRYVLIGSFHKNNRALLEMTGKPHAEGSKYASRLLRYLLANCPSLVPSAVGLILLKYIAYKTASP